jgi:hypothetical protein
VLNVPVGKRGAAAVMNWVGNNVNQIARAINSGIVPGMDLQLMLVHLDEVVSSIEQAAENVRRRM